MEIIYNNLLYINYKNKFLDLYVNDSKNFLQYFQSLACLLIVGHVWPGSSALDSVTLLVSLKIGDALYSNFLNKKIHCKRKFFSGSQPFCLWYNTLSIK